MADCEMCGATSDRLTKAKVEDTIMRVCQNCARHGSVLREPVQKRQFRPKKFQREEKEEYIDPGFSKLIKSARENKGLKQSELAKLMNEKESVIHNVESGHMKPPFKLAKKFEQTLHISIIKTLQKREVETTNTNSQPLTIGDLLKK